jgi:Xaa-Pro aminopeptidase
MHKRIKKLWTLVPPTLDGMLLTSPENVRYLSGFTGTEGTIVCSRTHNYFFTDGRYTTQAAGQVSNVEVVTWKEKWRDIGRVIRKAKISCLGYEARHATVAMQQELARQVPEVALQGCAQELDMLRAIKDAAEIRKLKKAARLAAGCLRDVLPLIKAGVREIDIAAELEYRMRRQGGEDIAFQTIVASGPRAALPHGVASDKRIAQGEFVVIDYGLVYQGYASDETCTVVVGRPSARQKKIYAAVKQAHDRAVKAVAPGTSLAAIDGAARRHIAATGFEKLFTHGTGHGLGLCVHEPPAVSRRSCEKARVGMVFTIEPGIYVPGWGGVRIEDSLVVTETGAELITCSDKALLSVG